MPFPLTPHLRQTIEHHFRRKKLVWDEAYFLDVLTTSEKKYDVYWAVIALRDCGTSRSIPKLKEKLFYPMQDVKCTAMLTIAHIAGAAETEFYAGALLNPEYREKTYAMWAIREAADQRAIEPVLLYFEKNWSKLKKGNLTNASLVDGLIFLERFREGSERVKLFYSKIETVWDNLSSGERTEIAKRVDYFSQKPTA
jgi:hypothetical protein